MQEEWALCNQTNDTLCFREMLKDEENDYSYSSVEEALWAGYLLTSRHTVDIAFVVHCERKNEKDIFSSYRVAYVHRTEQKISQGRDNSICFRSSLQLILVTLVQGEISSGTCSPSENVGPLHFTSKLAFFIFWSLSTYF